MNNSFHSDSCPSTCSSSIASLSSLPMTPETYPEYNPSVVPALYPALEPPLLDLEHTDLHPKPMFYIEPESFEDNIHECHTVPEEEEDDETASEAHEPLTPTSDGHSSIFINSSNEGFHNIKNAPAIVNTPATPPPRKTASPSNEQPNTRGKLRRQASEKIQGLMRRVHSSGHVSDAGQRTPSPTKTKGFFSGQRSPSDSQMNTSHPVDTLSSTLEMPVAQRPSSTFDGKTSSSSPKRPALVGAGSKSRMMSSVVPVLNVPVIPLSSKYTNHSHVPGMSKVCGEGVSAIVKVMHKISGPPNELYAIKEFRKKSRSETKEEYVEKISSEFCISKSLNHPNIVSTEDLCFSSSDRWCHVMEYCAGGDLFSLIEKNFMKDEEKMCCFKQLSKPGIVGSAPYISPEVQNKEGVYDARKLDVWSCAMVYFVLAFGGPLWHKANVSDSPQYGKYVESFEKWTVRHPDAEMTKDGTYPRHYVLASLKPATKRLLFQMMHLDPTKRITIQEALADRWVQSIECCNVDDHNDPLFKHVDAGSKSACKQAGKVGVHRLHVHLPPQTGTPFGREL
ncbi:uncharacterized protein H6S33_006398 [Morchella sextelata]|uniref:uncharacterized protein n=1 Tax=Morchella sextelata TaxID=1174677 RepID=UPI001D04F980|nr:uncharacterized protein H6S33_006398 [Morchella sextelata]KAH0604730.1 hypothetical protein H6S33_006398 [Morchella sextelata]